MGYTTGPALGDYLSVGINTLGALINGKAKVSAGAWIKPSAWNTDPTDFNANSVLRINITDVPQSGVSIAFDQSGTPVVKIRPAARSVNTDALQATSGATDLQGWAGDGKWHHVGVIADFGAKTIKGYVDGVQDASATGLTWGAATYTNNVTATFNDAIGGDGSGGAGTGSTGKTFKGDIAEWAVWGDDIGLAGMQALWARIKPRYVVPAQLLRYWTLRGRFGPALEKDFVAAGSFTVVGSAVAVPASHPQMFEPAGYVE